MSCLGHCKRSIRDPIATGNGASGIRRHRAILFSFISHVLFSLHISGAFEGVLRLMCCGTFFLA